MHFLLGVRIECGGRFIQHQDGRIFQDRTSDGDAPARALRCVCHLSGTIVAQVRNMMKKTNIVCHLVPAKVRFAARVAGLCAALVLTYFEQRTASACSVFQAHTLSGFPNDGDTAVPTDVVPFYDLSLASEQLTEAHVTLTSDRGEVREVAVAKTRPGTVELQLDTALEPNTEYTLAANLPVLSGSPELIESLTFTTGAGPLTVPPGPPEAFLQHYSIAESPQNSCSPSPHGTCVAVPAGLTIEETLIDEFGQESPAPLHANAWFNDLSGIDQGTNFRCVKLRTRAANATYSEPVVLCGANAPLLSIKGSENIACTAHGITLDDRLVSPPAPDMATSCSFTSRRSGSGAAVLSALLGLALLTGVRRTLRRVRA